MDEDACREEEERLEERVRQQVEHAGRVGADADGDEHVADLRHRRVRDHALDVRLHERDQPGDDERDAAEDGRRVLHLGRRLEDRRRAEEEVDAGNDHRRGVDERGDGRRAFHGVGKPRVERQLSRLRNGASE